MLRCAHKYYARLAQQAAVPEARPWFSLIDPDSVNEAALVSRLPLFIKPVKSSFSQFARRVDTLEELQRFVRSAGVRKHLTRFAKPFDQLLRRHGGFPVGSHHLLAEELLTGQQVTLEGYMIEGRMTRIGVVDSVMHDNAVSFRRFDYPSLLPTEVVDRMTAIAARVMSYAGFSEGIFNIEFFYDASRDRVTIIEINPRMCAQFADLMESVTGINTYEILVALAAGASVPETRGRGRFAQATSGVLRNFHDAVVVSVPSPEALRTVERTYPITLVKTFYREGQRLSDIDHEFDGYSYRYAVLNLAGSSAEALAQDFDAVQYALRFELADCAWEPAHARHGPGRIASPGAVRSDAR